MKTLFGNYILEYQSSVNGAPQGSSWTTCDIPKEGTATLDTSDGNKTELKDDRGKTVDSYTEPGTSTLTFALFKKKGLALPFPDTDGVVDGEWSFRIKSATDAAAPAFQIDRAQLSCKRQWSKTDAYRVEYTATALEPATGDQVKELGVDLDSLSMSFTSAADSTGQTIDVLNYNGTLTANVPAGDSWCTATITGTDEKKLKVTVTANSGTSAATRTTHVTVSDETGFSATVTVTQAA